MNREKLKTLILSILVAMSILLTQQLWFPSPFNAFSSEARGAKATKLIAIESSENIISPSNMIVSFGAGDKRKNYYTVLSSNLDLVWEESKYILKDHFLGEPEISQITLDTYIQSNTLKSVELEFANNTSTMLMSSNFNSLENKIVRNIKGINKILIPAFNRGVIYIFENEDSIFELKLPNYEENAKLISFIDKLENVEYIKYHPISSLFDEFEGIYTPMPVNYTIDTTQTFVESEIDIENEATLIERSKNFFNENFDFVKTVKETSGAVVYIYGYGEKNVRINNKGALEYNEEIGNISSTSVVASLDAAIDFIYQNGGLPEGTYLKDIQDIKNGQNKGYQFSFGYRIGGYPVEFNSNKMKYPIEIEVYGNKVKSYRTLVRKVMDMEGVSPSQSALHFPNIIEKNIKHLKSKYFDKENAQLEDKGDDDKILEILKNIEEVRMVYFDTVEEGKGQLLKPSWMIKIKGDIFYFDSYTGEIINSFTLN